MNKEEIIKDYIPFTEASEMIGYNRNGGEKKLFELSDKGLIETYISEEKINRNTKWVKKDSLNHLFEILKSDFITVEEASKMYEVGIRTLKENYNLNKIVIGQTHYLPKKQVIELYDFHDYLSLLQVNEITNLSTSLIYELIKKNEIFKDIKKRGPHYFIHKNCVEEAKNVIDNLREKYYTSHETKELLLRKSFNDFTKHFRHIRRPLLANAFDQSLSGSNYLYLKEDVDKFYLEKVKINYAPRPEDPYEYYLFLIEEITIPSKLSSTIQNLNKFVQVFVSTTNANKQSLDSSIKDFYRLTEEICTMELKKEIHLCDENELYLVFKEIQSNSRREQFYNFLLFLSGRTLCKFNIKKIKNPRHLRQKKEDKEVYTFEEFLMIYEMATNIDLHLSDAMKSKKYASFWLYTLVHLTNAWRHSDVIRIPQITPEVIGINSIKWFESNRINLPNGQNIINQLYNFELEISKTGMKRHFFCSQNLIMPIATSMIICEFHRRKTNKPSLIDFGTNYNIPSETMMKNFFNKSEKTKNIKFGSLKMNRSLMEHLFYSIQKQKGKGNSAFELVQKMRNHATYITKDYIRMNNETEEFGSITRQLFIRGEFGYIYDELIDVMTNEKSHSLEERTKEIEKTKNYLNPIQVETTMGFLNKRMNEKNSVIQQVRNLKTEEVFEYIRKLYLNEMPSKMDNVQCFTHPNCNRKTSQSSCLSCPFAIPNIYALNSLKEELFSTIESYQVSNTNGTKRKYSQTIEYLLDLLAQALNEFGEDFVWSFVEGGENTLEDELKKLT